jgi:sugar/nucleoside kinase (ribokinase family)
MKNEGVDLKHISISKLPTNYSVILLQNGERTILSYHGSLNDFSIKDVPLEKMKAKWWYISLTGKSYTMFSKLVRYAAKNGIKVALNPSGMHIDEGKEQLMKDLPYISFLVMNELEASHFTGISFKEPKKLFAMLDAVVPGIVAVTRGDDGVTVSDGVHRYSAGVFAEKYIADRTGAGDAFGSGFVAGLLRTKELCDRKKGCNSENIEYAIRLASANAASVIEYVSATPGILTAAQFESSKRFKKFPIKREKIA